MSRPTKRSVALSRFVFNSFYSRGWIWMLFSSFLQTAGEDATLYGWKCKPTVDRIKPTRYWVFTVGCVKLSLTSLRFFGILYSSTHRSFLPMEIALLCFILRKEALSWDRYATYSIHTEAKKNASFFVLSTFCNNDIRDARLFCFGRKAVFLYFGTQQWKEKILTKDASQQKDKKSKEKKKRLPMRRTVSNILFALSKLYHSQRNLCNIFPCVFAYLKAFIRFQYVILLHFTDYISRISIYAFLNFPLSFFDTLYDFMTGLSSLITSWSSCVLVYDSFILITVLPLFLGC